MSRKAMAFGGVALIVVAVGIATGWIWHSTATASAQVSEPISHVEIDVSSGNVAIRVDDVSTTQVKQTFSYRFGEPDNAFSVDDGTLVLEECGWWCSTDYEVVVPEGTTVSGEASSGDIDVIGAAGADIETSSGDITLSDIDGAITVDVSSGSVTGRNLSGDVTLDGSSSDIRLQFAEPANVTLDVSSGQVTLTVPDVPYRIAGDSSSGDRTIEVPTDPDAAHTLELETSSGDVLVTTS